MPDNTREVIGEGGCYKESENNIFSPNNIKDEDKDYLDITSREVEEHENFNVDGFEGEVVAVGVAGSEMNAEGAGVTRHHVVSLFIYDQHFGFLCRI